MIADVVNDLTVLKVDTQAWLVLTDRFDGYALGD